MKGGSHYCAMYDDPYQKVQEKHAGNLERNDCSRSNCMMSGQEMSFAEKDQVIREVS